MIEQLSGWLIETIGALSYPGILLLMALESTFLPLIPSELVLIPAGIAAAQGTLAVPGVLLAGALGSVLGASLNYYLAARYGKQILYTFCERYGKYLFINITTVHKAEQLFLKNSFWATFGGRLLLGVRHFISLPAGFVRMPLSPFILLTFAGSFIWTSILVALGYLLGNNPETLAFIIEQITSYSLVIILFLTGWFFYYLYSSSRNR